MPYLRAVMAVSAFEIWRTAWQRFEKHWATGILLVLLMFLLSLVPLIGYLIGFVVRVPLVTYGLRAWDHPESKVEFSSVFPSRLSTYLKVFVVELILGVIGILLLALVSIALFASAIWSEDWMLSVKFITGVGAVTILLAALQLFIFSYPFFIVDKDADIVAALRYAYRLSHENLGTVLIFFLYAIGVNILGAIVCGIGLFITIPLTTVAFAGLYRTLQAGTGTLLRT